MLTMEFPWVFFRVRTFVIPFDQPLDVRLHGYINRTRKKTQGNSIVSITWLAEFTEYGLSPCKSVVSRIVTQRKIMALYGFPEGGINFGEETIRHITLIQSWWLFYDIEYPTQCHNGYQV
jgi:hypothetical protein